MRASTSDLLSSVVHEIPSTVRVVSVSTKVRVSVHYAAISYASVLPLSVHDRGVGRFVLNTLHLRENLTTHPAADRLLLNLLRFAAKTANQPLADLPPDLPPDFPTHLRTLGY